LPALFTDLPHQFMTVPFMYDHHIRIVQSMVEVNRCHIILNGFQQRVILPEFLYGFPAMFPDQVGQAPAIFRLIDNNIIASCDQFSGNAA